MEARSPAVFKVAFKLPEPNAMPFTSPSSPHVLSPPKTDPCAPPSLSALYSGSTYPGQG
jgi:hypothetical protein